VEYRQWDRVGVETGLNDLPGTPRQSVLNKAATISLLPVPLLAFRAADMVSIFLPAGENGVEVCGYTVEYCKSQPD
jgi:hypothetical protein